MRANSSPRISVKRFQEAQKTEQEYWQQRRDLLLSEDYNKNKKNAALDIFKNLQAATDDGLLEKVLEVGGGGDPMIAHFRGNCGMAIDPLARFYKIDLLPQQLSSVDYFNGIGENLPFKEGYFDGVLAYNCIDHGIAPYDILSESKRVLRRGGALHLLVNTYSYQFIAFRKIVESFIPSYSTVDHTHYLRFNSVTKYLRNLGFVEIAGHHDEHPYSSTLSSSGKSGKKSVKVILKGHRAVRAFYRLEK
jgi:SAM-dependent methyltransferase